MTELVILKFFLLIAFGMAPIMTNDFFLKGSKIYSNAHRGVLLILLVGALFNIKYVAIVWPFFCVFGFFLYLRDKYKLIFTIEILASCVPFVFSLISSVWFVAGVLDLHLLGYGMAWSFYAALHGSFLGWLLVGCFSHLSIRNNSKKIYLWGCFLSFIFFLLVAFGIDGVPVIKRIGVIGFSLMIPFLIAHYALNLKKENRHSKVLSAVSLFSIFLSMSLAILNEFLIGFPRFISDVPVMVLTHGLLNAVLAVPFFFLAVRFELKEAHFLKN